MGLQKIFIATKNEKTRIMKNRFKMDYVLSAANLANWRANKINSMLEFKMAIE